MEHDLSAIRDAVRLAGGQTELANKIAAVIGKPVRQGRVWKWLQGTPVSADDGICLAIEQVTGVSRHRLREDVYGKAPVRPEIEKAA